MGYQFLIALAAIVSLTVLTALSDVGSDVTVPIIAALAGGGLGHVNGYRHGYRNGSRAA